MSGLFITKELREARDNIERTDEELINVSNQLYHILEDNLLKAQQTKGNDYITYIADRKIGKTYNLIRLALEYGYPLIVHNAQYARYLESLVKEKFGNSITILSYSTVGRNLDGVPCYVILKDEMVPTYELRKILNESRKGYINIVGIN